ncbi:MAG: hypothetical protein IT303_20515 [Dehalococcoidia bacterium]|nr:hypothetical protein [Dehalococcoidia bacterium]
MTQEFPKEYQDRAPGEYPKEAQNPKQEPGLRPGDQAAGEVRVPGGGRDVESMTSDERLREDPKRRDLMTPPDDGTVPDAVEREAGRR